MGWSHRPPSLPQWNAGDLIYTREHSLLFYSNPGCGLSQETTSNESWADSPSPSSPGHFSKSFRWGFAPDITDWTVICTTNWSWHPHQPALWSRRTNHRAHSTKMAPSQSYKRRRVACQHFPDDQTLRLQTGTGEDDIFHLLSGLDRVDCERQEEEEDLPSPSKMLVSEFTLETTVFCSILLQAVTFCCSKLSSSTAFQHCLSLFMPFPVARPPRWPSG